VAFPSTVKKKDIEKLEQTTHYEKC